MFRKAESNKLMDNLNTGSSDVIEGIDVGKIAMTPRGSYDSQKSYSRLDVVSYQGSSYVSKVDSNTTAPATLGTWSLLVDGSQLKGDQGIRGIQGPPGPSGKDAVIKVVTQAQYDALTDKSGVYFIEG